MYSVLYLLICLCTLCLSLSQFTISIYKFYTYSSLILNCEIHCCVYILELYPRIICSHYFWRWFHVISRYQHFFLYSYRIFSELGETLVEVMVDQPGQGMGSLQVLHLLLTCIGHHDWEVRFSLGNCVIYFFLGTVLSYCYCKCSSHPHLIISSSDPNYSSSYLSN